MSGPPIAQSLPLSPSPISPSSKSEIPRLSATRAAPPRSPVSPPLMSVSTKSYASSLSHTQPSPTETASNSRPQSSPLTSFSPSQHPDAHSTNPFPTPADSAYGISSVMEIQADDARKKDTNVPPKESAGSADRMEVDLPGLSSNQSTQPNDTGNAVVAMPKESQLASDEVSLEQIQKDMGEAFLTCRTTVQPSRLNPAEHLLSRYGLGPLVATVARTDPTTGEKINKLRKSYEGQIKNFGLAGKNKAEKRDDKPLMQMLSWPEQEWHVQKEASKKIEFSDTFKSRVQQAMKMQPGSVKNQAEWDSVLGHEKPLRPLFATEQKQEAASGSTPRPPPNGPASIPQRTHLAQGELSRPRRAGKKRSYDDNSFAGYGEGFVDDDGDMDIYSSDDQGRGGGRKRRKKYHDFRGEVREA